MQQNLNSIFHIEGRIESGVIAQRKTADHQYCAVRYLTSQAVT